MTVGIIPPMTGGPVSTPDLYWLAGILEGEGCFDSNSEKRRLTIRLHMTDRDVIERAHALMRITSDIYERQGAPGCKTGYLITAWSNRAAAWMMTIYPLMASRRQRAIRKALAIWRSVPAKQGPNCPKGHPYDEANTGTTELGHRYCKACAKVRWLRKSRDEALWGLLVGALRVMRAEFKDQRRGRLYLDGWMKRAEAHLRARGIEVPPLPLPLFPEPVDPSKVLPFPEYTPDAPGGSL